MQTGKSKTKQRQMPFLDAHQSNFFWQNHIQAWCETKATKAESTYREATSKNKKEI